jgi:hypothetical protein
MKKIQFTIAIIILMLSTIKAQDYSHNLQGIKKIRIIMTGSSDVKIFSSKSNKLTIHAEDFERKEKREGLRAIYSNGYDNSKIGLSVTEENGELVIRKLKPLGGDDYVFNIPQSIDFSIKNVLSGEILIEGFDSEIEAKTLSGDIVIKEVTGPILANSTSGNITVDFNTLAQQSPMSFVTVSGDVELVFPRGSKADLIMQTTSGTSYTNIDNMEIKKKKKEKDEEEDNNYGILNCLSNFNISEKIEAKINGGGVEILTKSVAGDIIVKEEK